MQPSSLARLPPPPFPLCSPLPNPHASSIPILIPPPPPPPTPPTPPTLPYIHCNLEQYFIYHDIIYTSLPQAVKASFMNRVTPRDRQWMIEMPCIRTPVPQQIPFQAPGVPRQVLPGPQQGSLQQALSHESLCHTKSCPTQQSSPITIIHHGSPRSPPRSTT